jgi:predicted RNA polymerase sigma factor
MRSRVETVIRDEAGNILSQLAPHEIDLKNQSLHEIEGAVENWKQQTLPEIEASLLTEAQNRFTQEIKKQKFSCNGTRLVWIKTLHGKFVFS